MNSHHTLHVSSELNCSLCGSRLHDKLNSKKPNIFRWYGIFVSEMHSCLYWCARLFAYICRRSCVPCPIRRCLPLPLFSKGMLPEFFPWLVRFSLTFAEDLHLPLKLWYLADALSDLGIGHLGPFRCKLCMSMRFQKISGESTTGRKSTCFFRKVEIQLLRYGDLQHNSKCPNLEFAPLNGIKFVTKGSKYMGESCCSYWFCSQSYYVLGTSIR